MRLRHLLSWVLGTALIAQPWHPSAFAEATAGLSGPALQAGDPTRIVCLGGTITETVFALGAGDEVVGVDTSSTFPAAAKERPQVGYQRSVAAEGILSLRPTLVLATSDAGPPAALQQLRDAGVNVVILQSPLSVAATKQTIQAIAVTIGRDNAAAALVGAIDAELAHAQTAAATTRPKVLFVYARGAGTLLVSGRDTAADEMIRLAGGENAMQEFTGFKPLTAESVVAAAPELLLIPVQGLQSLGGESGLLQLPGVALTPAAKFKRVVALDDLYLLGFGSRVGEAVRELGSRLHAMTNGAADGTRSGTEVGAAE